jgi:hypothetical protein
MPVAGGSKSRAERKITQLMVGLMGKGKGGRLRALPSREIWTKNNQCTSFK